MEIIIYILYKLIEYIFYEKIQHNTDRNRVI